MENRNQSTVADATGVIAPLIRAATHVGWCISYVGSIDAEELTDEQLREVINDLEDALRHLNMPDTSAMAEAFGGRQATEVLRETREDLTYVLPSQKEEVTTILQTIADNIANGGAFMEKVLTGNENAQAGRNI